MSLHRSGKQLRAEKEYKRYLAAYPADPEALMAYGVLRAQQGQHAGALALLSRAAEIDPGSPAIHYNRGRALLELGRFEEAVASLSRSLELAPGRAETHNNLASALKAAGRAEDATGHYREAVRLDPRHVEAHVNLAVLLLERDEAGSAADVLTVAARLAPKDGEVHYLLGQALFSAGLPDEARASFERTLAIEPGHAGAQSRLVYARRQACDWSGIAAAERELVRLVGVRGDAGHRSRAAPFVAVAVTGDPAVLHACARSNARRAAERVEPMAVRPADRRGRERIRIAYVAGDYRAHATSFLVAGLIEGHDRSRFEVIGVSFGPDDGSAMRSRMIAAFDRFIEVGHLSARETARLMRETEVDIAVDLVGYNQLHRIELFAWRPAPVQVNFLGFPGTTGAPFMDYIIADATVIPPGQEAHFSEKVVRLPSCYQANDRKRAIAATATTRADWGLPADAVVLCCFNNTYKLTPEVFSIWMRVLGAVPGSVLWLLDDNATATANLRREAAARGIEPARIVLAPRIAMAEHLARHAHADLFLDTLPYAAHTTASDALWAGVPVLTRLGDSFAGRVGASLLRAVGLPELIATTPGDYERLAIELARAPARLAALKSQLIERRLTCPLFDTDGYRRQIEAAYARMWSTWRSGGLPRGFDVPPAE